MVSAEARAIAPSPFSVLPNLNSSSPRNLHPVQRTAHLHLALLPHLSQYPPRKTPPQPSTSDLRLAPLKLLLLPLPPTPIPLPQAHAHPHLHHIRIPRKKFLQIARWYDGRQLYLLALEPVFF